MQQLPSAIFSKITDEQRKVLIKILVEKKTAFQCKCAAKESLYTLRPIKVQDGRYLICEKDKEPIPVTGDERVVICFDIDIDKYFMLSSITPSADGQWWRIDSSFDMFKLQRRETFRINIPPTYKSKAVFKDLISDKIISTGIMTDISSGGCKVLVDTTSTLKENKQAKLDIYIGRRDPISVIAEVRSIKKGAGSADQDSLGIMFRSVNSTAESKLFAITMELHRELTGKILDP